LVKIFKPVIKYLTVKKENVLATHIRISYSLYPKVGKNKEAHELSAYECH
jgi:hypothetical protein